MYHGFAAYKLSRDCHPFKLGSRSDFVSSFSGGYVGVKLWFLFVGGSVG